jgi:hypothetical protein
LRGKPKGEKYDGWGEGNGKWGGTGKKKEEMRKMDGWGGRRGTNGNGCGEGGLFF